jgi:VWFA-related protein
VALGKKGFQQQHGRYLVDPVRAFEAGLAASRTRFVAAFCEEGVGFTRGQALVEKMVREGGECALQCLREGTRFRCLRTFAAIGVERKADDKLRDPMLADETGDRLQVRALAGAMNGEEWLRGDAERVGDGEADPPVADIQRHDANIAAKPFVAKPIVHRHSLRGRATDYTGVMRARVLLPLVLASCLHAQTPASAAPEQTATLTVQSNIVFVPTTVQVHKRGEIIYGLTAKDFVVDADGVPQRVTLDDTADVRPIALAVVVQCSRSYAFEYPKMRGLSSMVEELIGGAPAQVAVMDFGSAPELLTNFTTNGIRRERAINSITPCDDDPNNAIFDAVKAANDLFAKMDPKGRHVILLVSETRDHGSKTKPQETIRALGRTDTIVDAMAYSPGRDEVVEDLKHSDGASGGPIGLILMAVQALRKNAAKEFSSESGGEYINFASGEKFDLGLNALANRVDNFYLLSFQPHFPPGHDVAGPLHSISVKVPLYPGALIRHRESYWQEPAAVVTAQP